MQDSADALSTHGGAGLDSTAMQLLNQQSKTCQKMLADEIDKLNDLVNAKSKEINRMFVPIVEKGMIGVYRKCAVESGQGSYKRMKEHMEQHVEGARQKYVTNSTRFIPDRC
jgi:hypothetical protein